MISIILSAIFVKVESALGGQNRSRFWKIKVLLIILICYIGGCSGEPQIQIKNTPSLVNKKISAMVPFNYILGPGDEIEVLYQDDPEFSVAEYFIGLEDTLRISFYYYPVLNKTVKVRPDGIITLHRIGEVKAVNMKPRDLAKKISARYKPFLTKPVSTVEAIGFNSKLEELKKTIKTTQRGQSRLAIVRPDGMISLPLINDIRAAGFTCQELAKKIESRYLDYLNNISITVALLEAHSNRVYIMGAVKDSNFYNLPGPVTLTQLIAMAGGFTDGANTHQVVHISRGSKGRPISQLIDMNDIIGRGDFRSDPIIRQYDVVFVPKTAIAKAAFVGKIIWNLIPLRFSAVYSLGGFEKE